MAEPLPYDALLVVSFGGPENPDEVMPFLEHVTRGRNVPRQRLEKVAQGYYELGGKSPINDCNRELIASLRAELAREQIDLPVYWGNRNSAPWLKDTVQQMRDDGVKHVLAIATSAFGSYSGCRQYRENIAAAREAVGKDAPQIDKVPPFSDQPLFVQSWIERIHEALLGHKAEDYAVLFTAHSIPVAMAETAPYVEQLHVLCKKLSQQFGFKNWQLVYQSRSGAPKDPWLEPSIEDAIADVATSGAKKLLVVPIGFVSDHMEVILDLDRQARTLAEKHGLTWKRVATPGSSPIFVQMIIALLRERLHSLPIQPMVSNAGAKSLCNATCCVYEARRS